MHTPWIHIMRSKARWQCIFRVTSEPTLIARQSSPQWEERNKKEDKEKKIACIAVLSAPRKGRMEWRRKMVSQTRKVWRRIQTKEDKSKKIKNEEVDCVALCEKEKKEDWMHRSEGIRKHQVINIEKKRRETKRVWVCLCMLYWNLIMKITKEMH